MLPRNIKDRLYGKVEWKCPWQTSKLHKNVAVTRYPVWVRDLDKESGIYFIRDRITKKLLYIGRSESDLKVTLCRHFRSWGPDRRGPHKRHVFDRQTVEVKIYKIKPEWVVATEAQLLKLHETELNERMETSRIPGEDDMEDYIVDGDVEYIDQDLKIDF